MTYSTKKEYDAGIEDVYGVSYSRDGKKLLYCRDRVSSGFKYSEEFGEFRHTREFREFFAYFEFTRFGKNRIPEDNRILQHIMCKTLMKDGEIYFYDTDHLTLVGLPDGLEIVGAGAFEGCENLLCVTFPETVTMIGPKAFSDCVNMVMVRLPKGLTYIGEEAFRNCRKLVGIEIPRGVTRIGENTFNGCDSLGMVILPETLTQIGDEAFNGENSFSYVLVVCRKDSDKKAVEERFKKYRKLFKVCPMAITEEELTEMKKNGQGLWWERPTPRRKGRASAENSLFC